MSLSLRARLVQRVIPRIMPGADLSPEEQRAKLDEPLGPPNRRVEIADPGISPLFADLPGLPPMHVQATTAEVLEDDARRLVDRATEAGVEAELEVFDELWHVFQTQSALVPEGREALERANAFIRTHTLGQR